MKDGTTYYHQRAEEVRALAIGILDLKERKRVVQIADDYENLARNSQPSRR